MCGIIGYLGDREATPVLMDGLKRLEYRGYDSAGVAVLEPGSQITSVTKSEAKVDLLIAKLRANMPTGRLGIGHTRWATHGKPTVVNARPHTDCYGRISVVHNGIIENFGELKRELEAAGHEFVSDTDTEVVPHLIEEYYKGDFLAAVRHALRRIRGAYALAMFSLDDPELLVGARLNAPLVVGLGDGESFVASDITAIIPYTKNALRGRLDGDGKVSFMEFNASEQHLRQFDEVRLLGMGTSLHAAMVGEHVIEDWAGLPARAQDASEFRYRRPTLTDRSLTVVITQSGETADTLVGLRQARDRGSLTVAVTNVVGSTAARDADGAIYLHSGPEIGVASTKTFVAHLISQYLLALRLATAHGRVSLERRQEIARSLRELPDNIRKVLAADKEIARLAHRYAGFRNFMYVGRGLSYPVALEGALKLKEISYLHAEGSSGGELKHGPIALLDRDFPVVAICTDCATKEKMISNVHEVVARDAPVLALVSEGDHSLDELATDVIEVPAADEAASAILSSVVLQLFAYHVAVELGCDVDQPRNLAKSVTVE